MPRPESGEGLGTSAALFGNSRLPVSVPKIATNDGSRKRARTSFYQSTQGDIKSVLQSVIKMRTLPRADFRIRPMPVPVV